MRRLAQFVRLFTSRVPNACVCVYVRRASVVLSRVCLASVSRLHLSRVWLSLCVCSRQGFRMRASASMCVGRRSSCLASVSRLSRVCVRLSRVCLASACICLASVSRLSRVYVRRASGVGRLVSRASVLVNACGNWLILCVGRHSKSLKGFCYRHTIYPLVFYLIMSQCQSIHPIT